MILRALASNQPYTLLAIPLASTLVLLPMFSGVAFVTVDSRFPIDSILKDLYASVHLVSFLAFLLIGTAAVLGNYVFNKHEFLNIPVFVPGFIYALIAASLSHIQLSLPALTANIFIILGLNRQLAVFRQQRVLSFYFESAFWYGMAAVVFPPFLLLIAGMLLAVLFTRAFHWREVLIPILAFAVPFLYWLVWLYWFDNMHQVVLFNRTVSWDATSFFSLLQWPQKIFVFACGISLIAALPRYLFLSGRENNKSKSVKMVFLIICITIMVVFFAGYLLLLQWILLSMMVPIMFLIGYWFSSYRHSFAAPFVFYALCILSAVLVSSCFW